MLTFRTGGNPRRRGSSRPGLLFGLAGFLIALATAGYVIYRDPPWGRLGKYNFSTPEQALKSDWQLEANGDIHALIELQKKLDRKNLQEKLNSLEVKRTAEYKGRTALFIQYKTTDRETKKEKERKEVVWYEKDEKSGLWRQAFVSSVDVRKNDEALAKDIESWTVGGLGALDD